MEGMYKKSKFKFLARVLIFISAVAFFISSFNFEAVATVYRGNKKIPDNKINSSQTQNRRQQNQNFNRYNQPVNKNSNAENIYNSQPRFSPYYAGSVRQDILNAALNELNYIRQIAGVPANVVLSPELNDLAQHGAVLLDALDTLTHTPSRPRDMDKNFYDKGYQATSHGNVHVGKIYYNGNMSGNSSLTKTLLDYATDDGHNTSTVGHRRWLLNPRLKKTGFGISTRNGYSVMYVIDEYKNYDAYIKNMAWPIRDDFISWPAKNNNHPVKYFPDSAPWSVSLNNTVYEKCDDNKIQVKLTLLNTGRTWNFSYNGHNDGYFNISHDGYAWDECIIFRPDNFEGYEAGQRWQVEISGLRKKNGMRPKIFFTTNFI